MTKRFQHIRQSQQFWRLCIQKTNVLVVVRILELQCALLYMKVLHSYKKTLSSLLRHRLGAINIPGSPFVHDFLILACLHDNEISFLIYLTPSIYKVSLRLNVTKLVEKYLSMEHDSSK